MAWNNQDPLYSNYGGDYNDSQFYGADQAAQGDASAYEMFEGSQNTSWEPQSSYGAYYDPNEFQQPSPQPTTAFQPPKTEPSAKGHPQPAG